MNELIAIEYKNQRILITEQLAESYTTDVNNLKNNFNNNKNRFIKGIHYFYLEGAELKAFKNQVKDIDLVPKNTAHLYLWTHRGASRHCKILDTDKAWEQFDALEENYFNPKEVTQLRLTDPIKDTATQLPASDLDIALMKAVVSKLEMHNNDIADLKERVAEIEKQKFVDATSFTEVVPNAKPEKPSIYVRNNVYSPASIAKAFCMGPAALNQILAKDGIIRRVQVYHKKTNRVEPYWVINEKYRNLKYSAQRYSGAKDADNSTPVEITYAWTPKGVGFIVNLLKYKGFNQYEDISNRTKTRTWRKGTKGGVQHE